MDQELIDEMYEGIGDANGVFTDIHNEDSVDIYSGLDISPKSIADEKTCTKLSPRVLESMDLYEEILAEEQESKESSHNELKTRFSAAINQIEELRKRLEQMETQNTALTTQNCRLKKNISALIRTARMEVVRKDKEIYRLNNGSGRTHGHHIQPHMNGLRNELSSSTPNGSRISVSRPPPPAKPFLPRDERLSKGPPQSTLKRQEEATLPPNASPTGTPASRPHPHISSKCSTKADLEPPTKNTDSLGAKPSGTSESHHSDNPQAKHRDSKSENLRKSETTDGRLTNGLDHEKECGSNMAKRSHRVERESGKSNLKSSKSRIHPDLEVHRRLDRAKSPPSDLVRISARSSSYRSKDKSEMQSKVSHREPGKDTTRDAYCRSSQKPSSKEQRHSHSKLSRLDDRPKDSKHKKGTSPLREIFRKEERKREEFRREERRGSKTERSREREGKPSKSGRHRDDVSSKEAKKIATEMSGDPLKGHKVAGKSSQEENSPNRKLCFMETLNLTLSPVKKPILPGDSKKQSSSPVHDVIEISTENDSEQPDVDDMCVIDEIGSSFSETDVVQVAELSKPPECPEVKEQQLDHKENAQAIIKTQAPAIGEEAEHDTVQGNVEYITKCISEVIDATEEEKIEAPAPEQPEQPCVSTVEPATVCPQGRTAAKTGNAVSVTGLTAIAGDSQNSDASNILHQSTPKKPSRDSVGVSDTISLDTDLCESLPVEIVIKESCAILSRCLEVDKVQHTPLPPQHVSPVKFSSTLEKAVYDISKDGDAVSSTISMEVLPEEVKLSEAISHFTQMDDDVPSITLEPSSSTGVSRVTSTTEEDAPPEKHSKDLTFTPKKSCGSAPGLSEERRAEPACSIPLHLDEDSMMLTLNSLKRIPDVISPLTSPMHPTKRAQPQLHSKPAHVKSLRKDFLNIAVDATSIKLDVNKENKHPDCPMKRPAPNSVDKTSKFPSIVPEDEIEEGEIVSESEEETVSSSPSNMTVKSARPNKNESNTPSFSKTSKRLAEEKLNASKTNSDWKSDVGSPSSTGSPSSNKSRLYKTICPALPNTSFSTAEEVMDVFKTIRFEVRKKYMKLHKTFPKKNFYGIVDNSIESFLEFVHVADLSLLCSHSDDLKVQLKNMITSVLSKVSNNGIVNRIFDQQSTHLKQKLWNFVDVQLDFLFKEIQSTLESVVQSTTVNHASRVDRETVPSENNKTSNLLRSPMKNTTKPKAPRREERQQVKKNKSIRSQTLVPCRTGLGSRGKDIRSILERQEKDPLPYQPGKHVTQTPPKRKASTPEKVTFVGQLSHSGSIQDSRSDFEILTEQQASSLTFNLVRDTQMGEIFKCLLQGSDLLDNSVAAGDGWPVGTPRKEAHALERLGITSPNRVKSPSKLIAPWASVSSSRMSSPQSKLQRPPNPAFLDESCLLEVPFELAQGRMTPQRNLFPQSPYSILAEDLAVSLTIPSPLKSDSHLSFLHPASMEPVSAPDSVISAHFSEDALMDGEDATEQDIHLVLDTDNSSCDSSDGRSAEPAGLPLFHFKPDLPMQAVVMERSNDHFIVRIRHASTSPAKSPLTGESFGKRSSGEEPGTASTDVTLRAEESLNKTLSGEELCNGEENVPGQKSSTQALSSMSSLTTVCCETGLGTAPAPLPAESSDAEMEDSRIFENVLTIAEEDGSTSEKDQKQSKRGKKRKAQQEKPKAKRVKNADEPKARKDKNENTTKVSKSQKSVRTKSSKKERCYPSSCVQLSPNSLSAKNVIKKKGEVMVTWTRDEDRAILVDLKVKGATSNRFSALSEKLHKSQAQIAERFAQLMKLFKKTEKMES